MTSTGRIRFSCPRNALQPQHACCSLMRLGSICTYLPWRWRQAYLQLLSSTVLAVDALTVQRGPTRCGAHSAELSISAHSSTPTIPSSIALIVALAIGLSPYGIVSPPPLELGGTSYWQPKFLSQTSNASRAVNRRASFRLFPFLSCPVSDQGSNRPPWPAASRSPPCQSKDHGTEASASPRRLHVGPRRDEVPQIWVPSSAQCSGPSPFSVGPWPVPRYQELCQGSMSDMSTHPPNTVRSASKTAARSSVPPPAVPPSWKLDALGLLGI